MYTVDYPIHMGIHMHMHASRRLSYTYTNTVAYTYTHASRVVSMYTNYVKYSIPVLN